MKIVAISNTQECTLCREHYYQSVFRKMKALNWKKLKDKGLICWFIKEYTRIYKNNIVA